MSQHFQISLREPLFDPASDQFIDSRYDEGQADLDLFSAGSGLVQVLQLLTFSLIGNHGMILLDEPDAHLHSSMQLIVVEVLERLARDLEYQILISTHSKEIINFVDSTMLVPVSSGTEVGPLASHASAVAVLEELGAIDNLDLYSLFTSRRCCFVEGKTDRSILMRVASRRESTVFEGDSRVVVIRSGGVHNQAPAAAVGIFSEMAGVDLSHFSIRDRDGLIDEYREGLQSGKVHLHHLDCIESFLVLPRAFTAIVEVAWRKQARAGDPPSEEDMLALVLECTEELKEATHDRIANAVDEYHARVEREHLTAGSLNEIARKALGPAWQAGLETRLRFAPGKKLLARCRERVKAQYNVTLTDAAIVDAATDEELAPLINLVERCEAL